VGELFGGLLEQRAACAWSTSERRSTPRASQMAASHGLPGGLDDLAVAI
jgi:hypothetical protein